MKIKRLSAPNIRDAMRRVREELGPEAVILSNRRVSNGVEIVAAVDYDESLVDGNEPEAAPAPKPAAPAPAPTLRERLTGRAAQADQAYRTTGEAPEDDEELTPRRPAGAPRILTEALRSLEETTARGSESPRTAAKAPKAAEATEADGKPKVVWSQDPMLVQMQQRLDAVYALLQQQVSGLAWGEVGRRQPQRADLLARLMDFGLTSPLCLELADRVDPNADLEQGWVEALTRLAAALPVADDEILTRGGVVALVGPTGVGKTTTVAKLAARYALRHGPRKVALVTTDSYRIGAYDQLRTFGMILDMPVRLAADQTELERAIQDFSDRELILIDTAGMSQRDLRLSQQFALLNRAEGMKTYLVLTANGQASAQEEVVAAFSRIPLAGCILTKLDETTRLGGALAVIVNSKLPLAYVSNGQRVPEDLLTARAEALVELAADLIQGQQAPVDQETLALTFGRRVANGGL